MSAGPRVLGAGAGLARVPLPVKVTVVVVCGGALLLLALLGALASLTAPVAQGQGCTVSGRGPDAGQVPPQFVPLYRAAAERYGLGPRGVAILAAIHRIESDFGRNMGPSPAGAEGQMQFMPGTWALYGEDGDGDGRADPYDAADAIPAAARYLRASGAPADWERALFAYNHADWYVAMVLAQAERFGGEVICVGALPAAGGAAEPQRAVRLYQPRAYVAMPAWAHAGAGAARWPRQSCDARMSADLLWLLASYDLRIHDCRAAGHATHGDGTAADIVPREDPYPRPGGRGQIEAWDRVRAAAELLGWRRSCAATGCIGASTLSPAIRAIFYDGFPNHGDPAHFQGPCGCPHMHVSWMSSFYGSSGLVPPNRWTMAFPIDGRILTGTEGFEGAPS